MDLTYDFLDLLPQIDEKPELAKKAAELVLSAPKSPESDGLLAYMYHQGIGVEVDLDKAFDFAERGAQGNDGTALYLLGHMCDNAETPDQAEGGPRQKYDQYDAESFMERCARTESPWAEAAHLWLGDFFLDMARGGDPDVAIEHYEAIGHVNSDAAGMLSDIYWDEYAYKPDAASKAYEWTLEAVRLNPHDYSYRMGCICADGIGCPPSLRLARKYFEDAYCFGHPDAQKALDKLLNHPPQ